MNNGRKKHSVRRIALLFICLLVVGYLFTGADLFAREEQEEVDYNEPIDSEMFTEHPIQLAGFNELPAPVEDERLVENLDEPIQEFSFVNKTFRTTVDQLILVRFTSKLAADKVLIRIPTEGNVLTTHFSNGESIHHSHGEYWTLQTQTKQIEFELPVAFVSAGQYFLTIDHDADQFYLEVEEVKESFQPEKEDNTNGEKELSGEEGQWDTENHASKEINDQEKPPLLEVVEHYLTISDNLLELEDARVLEETRDPQERSTSNVGNWTQFRSAWNNSSTTVIRITSLISAGSLSLNARSTSVIVSGSNLNFENTGHSLVMNGSANLQLAIGVIYDRPANLGRDSRTSPIIVHNGSGTVDLSRCSLVMITGTASSAIVGQNINVVDSYEIRAQNASSSSATVRATAIQILRGGTLNISYSSGMVGYISSSAGSGLKPILSDSTSTINIESSRTTMSIPIDSGHGPLNSWNSVHAKLGGLNGETVLHSDANPNDFHERYPVTFNDPQYGALIFNATGSDWINPPVMSYDLALHASPIEAGRPTSEVTTIDQGATTIITANPNQGYNFVHWEIVSGIGSSIASLSSETTTFTMGNQNTVVRAVYEENQASEVHVYHTDRDGRELIEPDILTGSIGEAYQTNPAEIENYQLVETPDNAYGHYTDETISVVYVYDIAKVTPVDPLDPEVEINPENKPELPENQGLLSIDFASKFQFGRQTISAQDQQYYAEPQRLLNEDGEVNDEERPNYVQISDRRSADERGGWQLAVTQNTPFISEQEQILAGARLRLTNQQLATAQNGTAPEFQQTNPLSLVPGSRRILLMAQGDEGTGTWIYRFGDENSAGSSVVLDVPRGATPDATSYSTTLTWELSAVPGN
ncbi:WxL domain-containing protein [Enterococcus sp. 5H]|uniref:WxL domain-containing protein n=1 Tax=Enterococcus sp. 5H TaxID=1229490 RepID=UPI002304CAD6|nr:WxL domain-containing protein [Enterococcus sp. 5H]